MPTDLVTRLLLQSNQFDKNINSSAKKVRDFSSGVDKSKLSVNSFGSKIGSIGVSTLAKFAGGIGLAISAGEGLTKMMRSNQTTSDLFDNNVNAAKDSVDAFFRSLATGDWTAFENGLIGAFNKLKDVSIMMDELADKKLSLSFIKADDMKDIKRFEQIAKDTNNTLVERKNAVQNLQGVVHNLNKKTKETIDFQMATLNKKYSAESGLNISADDLKYFHKNTNFDGSGLSKQANDAYKEFVRLNNEAAKFKKAAEYDRTTYGFDKSRKYQKQYAEGRDAADTFKKENEFLIAQGWLTEENDIKRTETVNTLIEQLRVEEEIYALQQRVDKTNRTVAKQDSAASVKKNAQVDKNEKIEIALQNSLSQADDNIKAEIYKIGQSYDLTIPVIVKPEYEVSEEDSDLTGSIIDYQKQIQSAMLSYNEATTAGLRALYAKQIDDIEKHLQEMTDVNGGMIDISKELNNIVQSGVLEAFKSIGEAIASDDAGEAMKNMLSGMMEMLQQFGAALVAAGIAKIAFDKLLANPYAAIAAGGALIIATTIAKASLNKAGNYSEGGVAPMFTVGDRMTIGINGGEMILTTGQQAKLFDLMDLGRTSISNDERALSGRLVAEGSQLVAVIDSTMKKQRRGR